MQDTASFEKRRHQTPQRGHFVAGDGDNDAFQTFPQFLKQSLLPPHLDRCLGDQAWAIPFPPPPLKKHACKLRLSPHKIFPPLLLLEFSSFFSRGGGAAARSHVRRKPSLFCVSPLSSFLEKMSERGFCHVTYPLLLFYHQHPGEETDTRPRESIGFFWRTTETTLDGERRWRSKKVASPSFQQ